MKTIATLIRWDSIAMEAGTMTTRKNGDEIELTRGNDETLKQELMEIECEVTGEPNPENNWEITSVTHGPATTTVEHASGRGHLGLTTIVWED